MEFPTASNPAATPRPTGADRERRIDAVQAEIGEVCGHLNALHGRLVALIASVLEDDLWRQAGIRSPEHWATWQLGVSATSAKRLVAAARRFDELPATMAAITAGELTLDQITPIVETAPQWADARVAGIARYATVAQIRRVVRGYPHPSVDPADSSVVDDRSGGVDVDPYGIEMTDPPGTSDDADGVDEAGGADEAAPMTVKPDPEPALEPTTPHDAHGPVDPHQAEGIDTADLDTADPESFSLIKQPDGSWRFWGRLDADHGWLLDSALREIADRGYAESGTRPTRAAALIELVTRHHGSLAPERRSRYRVTYLIDERRQLCDPHGITLPDWMRELITCDADSSITWQRNGIPIAHTNATSDIPAAIRRHVVRRDGGRCRFCGGPGRHLHHIRHREHHGDHHPANLALLCEHCHRLHHRGIITIGGNPELDPSHPDALHITDNRTGRRLKPNALVRPPSGPPPPASSGYRHPTGEQLDIRWIDFEPPPSRDAA